MMKSLSFFLLFILSLAIPNSAIYGQKLQRDTTTFKEHQVLFEKMEFIPSHRPVKLIRILNNDTAGIEVLSDPYWISCLVSNKEYKEYLNAIKSRPVQYQTALPSKEIYTENIKTLEVTYQEYFENAEFEHFPVLGISWEQARLFCSWKTQQVNKELDEAGLPPEKKYRLPLASEIEGAKHFTSINIPRVFKENASVNTSEIIRFNNSLDEWTLESFYESTYLKKLSFDDTSPHAVIYQKMSQDQQPYRKKDAHDLNVGFRYAQTYRKVKVPDNY